MTTSSKQCHDMRNGCGIEGAIADIFSVIRGVRSWREMRGSALNVGERCAELSSTPGASIINPDDLGAFLSRGPEDAPDRRRSSHVRSFLSRHEPDPSGGSVKNPVRDCTSRSPRITGV